MKNSVIGLMVVAMLPWSVCVAEQQPLPAKVEAFLASGFGTLHPEAPAPTRQFGHLVGVWRTEQEMAKMDGTWQKEAPGLWAWKYTLDGFAVQEL